MFDYEYWGNEVFSANTNMILEEFFLRRSSRYPVASVRFFSVPKDSVVLGYAQATDAIKKPDGTFDIVRRLTGGSHVQIGSNILAYSFAVPRDGSFRNYEDMRAYYAQHVADALEDLEIETTTDNRASTINVDGKVVASHALIWGVQSALLHGLIVLSPYDVDKIYERVFLARRRIGNKFYSEYAALKNIPAISHLLQEKRLQVLKEMIGNAILQRVTKGRYRRMKIGDRVLEECSGIETKYKHETWLKNRKPPFTKEEIEKIPGEKLDGRLKEKLGYCLYIQVKDRHFKKMAAEE